MFKMIVVDDEYLVRMGIRNTIEWEKYGIEIIGEATNGKAGLQMALELKPDIIITDIKMPIMDGLELVKHINESKLDCVIIILSGYKDFEYAKDTLENGAYSYLLKPIDNDELISKITNALQFLEEKRAQNLYISNINEDLPTIRQTILQNLIIGNFHDYQKLEKKLQLYDLNIPKEGTFIYGKVDSKNDDKALEYFYELFCGLLKATDYDHIGSLMQKYFVLISSALSEECESICQAAIKQYEKTQRTIVSLGIATYKNYDSIEYAYNEAHLAAEEKLFPLINTVNNVSHSSHKLNPQITRAMQYIAQNYSRNITVKMVAESLFVSESYLMHLFKDNLNKTFNECLTDYRIMVAKDLLLSGKLKVYEIAELVGYNDSKYFSQIFRKKVGMSPSQFLENEVMR